MKKCEKCGYENNNKNIFCGQCGEKLVPTEGTKFVKMRCKECDGMMDVNSDKTILSCPYCGAKELVVESDKVQIEKIKSNTKVELALAKIKSREKQIEHAEKKEQEIESKLNREKYKNSKFAKFTLGLFLISMLITMLSFPMNHPFLGVMMVIVDAMLAVSWAMGMQLLLEPRPNLHVLLVLGGITLLFILLSGTVAQSQKYVWPKDGLARTIPRPKSHYGEVNMNYEDHFSIKIKRTSEKQHYQYINKCKKKGFNRIQDESNRFFTAYDSVGNKLSISYYSDSKEMNISVDAAKEYKKPISKTSTAQSWPSSTLSNMIPKPDSDMFTDKFVDETMFEITVGGIDEEKYNEYVDKCREYGFTLNEDMLSSKHTFGAENTDKISLYVIYNMDNSMKIAMFGASKDEESDEEEVDTSEVVTTQDNATETVAEAVVQEHPVMYMTLNTAKETLESEGYTNIVYEPSGDIWDKSNWVVTSVSIDGNDFSKKDKEVTLSCISSTTYLSDNYLLLSVTEVQKIAEEKHNALTFKNYLTDDNMDEVIESMSDDEKKLWVTKYASYYSDVVHLSMVYSGNVEMPDVKGMILNDALKLLKEQKFSGIESESDDGTFIWNYDNWTVIDQSIAGGVKVNADGKITLTAKHNETEQANATTSEPKQVFYSTNTEETVENGDSGVYAYRRRGANYDLYYIINFDEGYVYYFQDGQGYTSCDKVIITSGTLNDKVIITYDEGEDYSWQEGLRFKWKNEPSVLEWIDSDGFKYEYRTTDLGDALKKLGEKKISEY